HWLAVWLIAFLAVAWIVIARYNSSLAMARELSELRTRRANLEGHRADLERRMRAAESRAVLVPRAQRLGLRLPSDSEIILLPLPPGDPRCWRSPPRACARSRSWPAAPWSASPGARRSCSCSSGAAGRRRRGGRAPTRSGRRRGGAPA